MRALLDVNLLIALFDADHVYHERATLGLATIRRTDGHPAPSPKMAWFAFCVIPITAGLCNVAPPK